MLHSFKNCLSIAALCFAVAVVSADEGEENRPAKTVPDEAIAYKTVEKSDGSADELDLNVFYPPGYQTTGKLPALRSSSVADGTVAVPRSSIHIASTLPVAAWWPSRLSIEPNSHMM